MNKRITSLSLGLLLISSQMAILAGDFGQKNKAARLYIRENQDLLSDCKRKHGLTDAQFDAQLKDELWSQVPVGDKLHYYGTRAITYTGVGLSVFSVGDLLYRMYKNPKQREALTGRLMTSAIPLLMVSILGLYGF